MKTIADMFRKQLLNKQLISEPTKSGSYHLVYLTKIFDENIAPSYSKRPSLAYRFYGFHVLLKKGKKFSPVYIKLEAEDFNMWKCYSHYKDKLRIRKMNVKLAKAMLSVKESPETFTNLSGI